MICKCTRCHHEWQSIAVEDCDWCGAAGKKIADDYIDTQTDEEEIFERRLDNRFKNSLYVFDPYLCVWDYVRMQEDGTWLTVRQA